MDQAGEEPEAEADSFLQFDILTLPVIARVKELQILSPDGL